MVLVSHTSSFFGFENLFPLSSVSAVCLYTRFNYHHLFPAMCYLLSLTIFFLFLWCLWGSSDEGNRVLSTGLSCIISTQVRLWCRILPTNTYPARKSLVKKEQRKTNVPFCLLLFFFYQSFMCYYNNCHKFAYDASQSDLW